MKKHAKQLFWNTLLLTAVTLLIRTVGVGFQVYVSNHAGAEAMGLFSLMSGVYGFALTLATSGIHLGVTHVVVDAVGRNTPERVAPVMRRAVIYALSFGVGTALLLTLTAEPIGIHWLRDDRTVRSLRLFGTSLPLIALSSVFNGYFTALRRSYKTAATQVFEQGVKIGATMALLVAFTEGEIEAICCALVLGGVLAEVASFFLNLGLYCFDRCRNFPAKAAKSAPGDARALVKVALPVALTAYLRSGLITLQHILIPEGLRNSGSSHREALMAYGSIHSMALPIVLYPAALISSCAGLLIPEIAECHVRQHTKRISYMISRVWWLALVFSIGVAGILICFSEEIGQALYPGSGTAAYIRLLAPLVPIMYIDTATDAVLKGLGEQVYTMNVNIIDALISVIMVWLLVPRFGIGGYLVTIYVSEFFNTVFSITHLLSLARPTLRLVKWIYKPLLAIVGATTLTKLVFRLPGLPPLPWGLALGVCILLYLGLLLLFGDADREDLGWFRSLFCKETH